MVYRLGIESAEGDLVLPSGIREDGQIIGKDEFQEIILEVIACQGLCVISLDRQRLAAEISDSGRKPPNQNEMQLEWDRAQELWHDERGWGRPLRNVALKHCRECGCGGSHKER